MKMRKMVLTGLCLTVVFAAVFARGEAKKPKPGPLTGTWDCTAHGGAQGDMPFTLYLEQTKDSLTGSVSSPMGGTQVSGGSVKKNDIELHFDTPQGNYQMTGRLKKGELSGKWSGENESGTWEGKRKPSGSK